MEDLRIINEALQEARNYGLEVEVIKSALNSMKSNSNQSVVEAMQSGLNEWIK